MLNLNNNTQKYFRSIATFILVAVLFLSCQNNNVDKIRSFSHPPGAPEITASKIEVLYSDSAVVRSRLTAPQVMVYQDEDEPYKEFPDGLQFEKFDGNHKTTSYIRADYGKNYEKKGLWELRQNVVAVTEDGDSLKTDVLFWDEKKDMIYSDQFVKFIQQEQIITGIGFESDLQMKNWRIKNVKGTVVIEVDEKE